MTDHPTVPAQGVAEPEIELRIAVLSDALKSISKNTCCDNCREAANVARSALASYVGLAREANHTLPFHDETMAGLSSLTIRAASQPPAAAPTQGVAQPVAYVVFTEGGNIRIWSKTTKEIEAWAAEKGLTVTPVYAAPISSPAETSEERDLLSAQDYILRCRDMLDDVLGKDLEAKLTHYIGSYMALQITAQQLAAQVEGLNGNGETVPVPKAALDWLFGEGKDKDGWGFGECRTAQLALNAKNPRRYWWRSKFRAMIPALSQKHPSTDQEARK